MSDNDPTMPAPGWYPDGHGEQRWWDGRQWTDRTLPPPGAAMPPTPPMPGTDSGPTAGGGRGRTLLVGALVVGVVLLLSLIVLNVVLLAG